jgi:TonB-linked SusC/RagA family outer membrane protein
MTSRTRKCFIAPLIALVLTLFAAQSVLAQGTAVITGRVTSDQGLPVPGAEVSIPTLGLRARTDSAGTYRLAIPASQARGQTVTIVSRFIGYTPTQHTVTASGTQTVNFGLAADPFNLSAVVVTGVATGTEQRNLPFTVAHVSEEQVTKVPASSPVSALEGKVSGVRVSLGNGAPGTAPAIRLRGSTNLAIGGSQPLIIVDGVATRSSIADIDANDIASIEVLKGAAASSFYGSNGANGVIAITTKRGKNVPEGNVQVISRSEIGQSSIQHWPTFNHATEFLLNPDGSVFLDPTGSPVQASIYFDQPYATTGAFAFRNQLKEWMQKGTFYSTNVQVGMRRGNTNFGSSFTSDHNAGVLPLRKGQYRQNARVNVDQGLGDKLDVSLGMTYGNSNVDVNTDPSGGGDAFFELMQTPPNMNLATPWYEPTGRDTTLYWRSLPFDPSARGNPLYLLAYDNVTNNRERFLGSVSGRYRALSWLNFDVNYGTDRLNSRTGDYQPKGFLSIGGVPGTGYLNRSNFSNNSWNGQVAGTATGNFLNAINSTTRVAMIYDQLNSNYFYVSDNQLNVQNVSSFDAADPTKVGTLSSNTALERNVNYLADEALIIKGRYIIDGMLRRDGSSLFGSNNRFKNFYRISGAWRLSEDFHIPGVQELKLRAGRGTAGLRPGFADQYEAYTTGGGQITKNQLGNKNLQPAVATEDEFGINATFASRFNVELVQANRVTRGAFLAVPLEVVQSGGYQTQVQNAADISARTTELTLETEVFNRPNMSYSFTLTGDHTKQKIDKLGRAPFRVAGLGQGQDMFYYKSGEPLGIIYGNQWVRNFSQLKDNPAYATAVASDFSVNRLGYLVNTASPGTLIKYVNAEGDQHVIGNVNPDYNWGLANNFRVGNFNVYALFDGQHGGNVYNFTKQWMTQDKRLGDADMSNVPQDQKVPLSVFTGSLYGGLNASDYFVEDGSYVKLRELSVSYTLAGKALQITGLNRFASGVKLALIGRNLYTWTKYTGFDPDVTGGGDFNFRVDGFRYPNFRTITGQVEFTF